MTEHVKDIPKHDVMADIDFIFKHLKAKLVRHKYLDVWRADLLQHVWRQKSLLQRTGTVGADWERLIIDCEKFAFIEQSMLDEIKRRRAR